MMEWDGFQPNSDMNAYSSIHTTRYRYVYACPSCGLELPSKKRRRASCGKCNPSGYDDRYRLTLTESRANPGPVLRGERPVRAS